MNNDLLTDNGGLDRIELYSRRFCQEVRAIFLHIISHKNTNALGQVIACQCWLQCENVTPQTIEFSLCPGQVLKGQSKSLESTKLMRKIMKHKQNFELIFALNVDPLLCVPDRRHVDPLQNTRLVIWKIPSICVCFVCSILWLMVMSKICARAKIGTRYKYPISSCLGRSGYQRKNPLCPWESHGHLIMSTCVDIRCLARNSLWMGQ